MTTEDLTPQWIRKQQQSGRRVSPAGQSGVALMTDHEEAYGFLYDSRDDSRIRIPTTDGFERYYLHKKIVRQEIGRNGPVNVEKTAMPLYHKHSNYPAPGGDCPLGLDKETSPAVVRAVSEVAPADDTKPRRRHRGSRGRKRK